MIEAGPPVHWKDLEGGVARILHECGFQVEVNRAVKLVRGSVNLDVYARDDSTSPPTTLAIECKHWSRPASKNSVHSFRAVVSDAGMNLGFLVSSAGFQGGAHDAALYSNVLLTDWEEFQSTFAKRWYEKFMLAKVREGAEPLTGYVGPPPSFGFLSEIFPLSRSGQRRALALADEYANLGWLANSLLRFDGTVASGEHCMLQLH